jgi:hypothetical protein
MRRIDSAIDIDVWDEELHARLSGTNVTGPPTVPVF